MAANPPCLPSDLEELRGEIRKIVESSGFAGARQLQAFLAYTSEAVFEGRATLEQAEIAREVLGKGEEFNPIDDPSVRKIASLLRQRLQKYYETEGADDRVTVSLPLRSYLPVFQVIDAEELREEIPAPVERPVIAPPPRRRHGPMWLLAAALLLGGVAGFALRVTIPSRAPEGEFHIRTSRGGISNQGSELARGAIQLGPEVGEHDEVVVRMRFRPTRPAHQAGLLIFTDPDNYVAFGRVFRARAFLEFGSETEGHYQKPEAQVRYDPTAQTLDPIWLALRRNGDEYRAFTSIDGVHWSPFGIPRVLPKSLGHPRLGIYAYHGRTSAQPAEAIFDRLGVGPSLHDWPDETPVATVFGGWQPDRTCASVGILAFDGPGIRFTGINPVKPCTGEIVRPVPSGDWSISTRVDFIPMNGVLTGLQVRGSRGRFRIVRWTMNGDTISAEVVHGEQAHAPDFSGHPPVTLRIDCRAGVLQASFSRDGVEYTKLPLRVPLEQLGTTPVVGYQLGKSGWHPGEATPPLVYWIRQEIHELHPYL